MLFYDTVCYNPLHNEYNGKTSEFPSVLNFQKNICQKVGKVNWKEPQKESRGHNIGSKWFNSSLTVSPKTIFLYLFLILACFSKTIRNYSPREIN